MRRLAALGIASLALVGTAAFVVAVHAHRSGAEQTVYALDDAYIHMAIARHLTEDGVYGVTPFAFSSSSSSPLYVFLLAGSNLLFGVRDAAPLVVNLLAALALLCVAWWILADHFSDPRAILGWLIALIYLPPLVPVVFTGMEHLLQMVLTLAFLYLSTARIVNHDLPARYLPIYLLCPWVTIVRYEGVFAVLVVCALLASRRRWVPALTLAGLGALPIVAFGAYSMAHGAMPLPNPVLLQGNPAVHSLAGIVSYPLRGFVRLAEAPHLSTLVVLSLVIFLASLRRRGLMDRVQLFQVCFVTTTLFHEQFAKNGWFYRYEAYLVVLGIVAVAIGSSRLELPRWVDLRHGVRLTGRVALALLFLAIAAPLVVRGVTSLAQTPRAMTNIYHQQYQMGRFLREHYQGQPVAANDIGAINYLADIRNLDLVGLGSVETLRIKLWDRLEARQIEELTRRHRIRIALLYEDWFVGARALPAEWVKVGEWTIPDNLICASDTVAFYAASAPEARILERNLADFSSSLPAAIGEQGEYVSGDARR